MQIDAHNSYQSWIGFCWLMAHIDAEYAHQLIDEFHESTFATLLS
jgi:hypothetical protein